MAEPKPKIGGDGKPVPEEPHEPSSPPANPGGEEPNETDLSKKLKLSEDAKADLEKDKQELESRLSNVEKELAKNREEQRLSEITSKVEESIRLGAHKPADKDEIIKFAVDLDTMEKVDNFLKLSTGNVWSPDEAEPEEEEDADEKLSESGKTKII